MIHTDGTPTIAHRPPVTKETRYVLTDRGLAAAAGPPPIPEWLAGEVRAALAACAEEGGFLSVSDAVEVLGALAEWCGIVVE